MSEPTVFYASFPTNAIAIRMHGDGGYRITLDVSESEAGAMVELAQMRGKTMIVTAQVEEPTTCTDVYDATEKETERSPASVDYRRTRNRRD